MMFKNRIVFTTILTALVIFGSVVDAQEKNKFGYKTKEFNDPNSRIPSVFTCAYVGMRSGLGEDATELLVDSLLYQGISKDQIRLWGEDLRIYLREERSNINLFHEWENYCKEPFAKMRAVYGRN